MTFYKLTHQEWLKAANSLCPAQKDIYLYLKTLSPFENRELKVSVDRIASDLKMHRDTVMRHLRELRKQGWLTYQVHSLIIKFTSAQVNGAEVDTIQRSFDRPERSNDRPERSNDLSEKTENPCKEEVVSDQPVTNNRSLKLLNQTLVNTQNDQSGIGQILAVIEAIGIRANQTIQTTIHRLQRDVGAAAAARRVELAIESLREQSEKGNVQNPGGFLNAALQRCFTPNDDGYRERKTREKFAELQPAPGRSPSPALASPPGTASPSALDLLALQQQCDSLILKGKLSFAVERLQEEIAKGNLNAIRSLLRMRHDWGFKLSPGNRITLPLQT